MGGNKIRRRGSPVKNGEKTGKKVQVHVPYPVLLEKFDYILDEGISPEVYLDGGFLDNALPKDLERIREEFGKRSLTVTMHGPYTELNPGSQNEETRTRTVERYKRVFEVVSVLRPRNVVLHAGYHERKFHGDYNLWLSQSLKTWPRFVRLAEESGAVIAVENIFDTTPDALKMLMDEIESPNFGVCIDSGHLNVFSKVAIEEWFMALGHRIVEVHLHDNFGNADDHLPLGEGGIDFPLFFSLIRKYSRDPVYTIEPHGEEVMRRSMKAVKKYI